MMGREEFIAAQLVHIRAALAVPFADPVAVGDTTMSRRDARALERNFCGLAKPSPALREVAA